jgi:hypothetical protein
MDRLTVINARKASNIQALRIAHFACVAPLIKGQGLLVLYLGTAVQFHRTGGQCHVPRCEFRADSNGYPLIIAGDS